MDKKELEILIQKLKVKDSFSNVLEQYDTDPSVVAYVVNMAYLDGNIFGKRVFDAGTGNGSFAFAAAKLGAEKVLAIDIDQDSIDVAMENCRGLDVEFKVGNVEDETGIYDTCLMNPPWGAVEKDADIPFLDAATRTSSIIYSIHNAKGKDFVRSYFKEKGTVLKEERINLTIKRRFSHHKKDKILVNGVLFVTEVAGNH